MLIHGIKTTLFSSLQNARPNELRNPEMTMITHRFSTYSFLGFGHVVSPGWITFSHVCIHSLWYKFVEPVWCRPQKHLQHLCEACQGATHSPEIRSFQRKINIIESFLRIFTCIRTVAECNETISSISSYRFHADYTIRRNDANSHHQLLLIHLTRAMIT